MAREELTMRPAPERVLPFATTCSTSPPWAPIPGTSSGMHNSVVCAEDVPFFAALPIDRAQLAATYLGTRQLDGLEAVCRVWPRGAVDEDLHAPLRSAVPALLLSGSDDPATPPAYAHEVARAFTQHLDLVLEGFGHGQLTSPCVDRIMVSIGDLVKAVIAEQQQQIEQLESYIHS